MIIENETVYVVYRNGEPLKNNNRKSVYTKRSSASLVITTISKNQAQSNNSYWNLNEDQRKELIEEIKNEFEIIEYNPARKEK